MSLNLIERYRLRCDRCGVKEVIERVELEPYDLPKGWTAWWDPNDQWAEPDHFCPACDPKLTHPKAIERSPQDRTDR